MYIDTFFSINSLTVFHSKAIVRYDTFYASYFFRKIFLSSFNIHKDSIENSRLTQKKSECILSKIHAYLYGHDDEIDNCLPQVKGFDRIFY